MLQKTKAYIFYSTNYGRNDGCPLYYFNVLKNQLKLNTTHLDPKGDISRFGKADLSFWVDWGEDGLIQAGYKPWSIPEGCGKKIYVVSDAHIAPESMKYRIEKAKEFDYVFLNQSWYLPKFKEAGIKNVFYLPHAAEPKAYPHFKIIPKYDVVFIGHIQEFEVGNGIGNRLDFLDSMFKEFPNFYYGGRNPVWPEKNMFEDASKKFCESKIVLNISIGNDLNMRFYEAMMSGSFLLTNKIAELKSAKKYGFIDGIHYVSYSSLKDAIKKAKYYIAHDEEREKIAKAGYKQALKTGTYKSRVEEILRVVSSL